LTCQEQENVVHLLRGVGLGWAGGGWGDDGSRDAEGAGSFPRGVFVEDPGQAASPRVLRVQRLRHLTFKQKGHFFVEDQIYCEKHARERVVPPEGYEVGHRLPKVNHAARKAGVDGFSSAAFPQKPSSLPAPAKSCLQQGTLGMALNLLAISNTPPVHTRCH